ncbi:acyl-CoA hydrolase [Novosphingobium sp. PhB165]|uniref:acetyl-CoA hydrolase/transferase C-terminal domain-containing protein n=1 Tax=Novosphingobium sp. PhB165 TaxID=2485105 RepID=UPI00104FD031|nr:acetyl-CoA hydrolase/transferase C-terminal domain-containing protein [Novosphingobium sp. PhB165]TCM20371.1 acyl-CoA hydrolase [Novosphingobium sp. PhB165]
MTICFADPEEIADRIIAHTGGRIVLGLPLGLGKSPHIANALFERARRDPAIRLDIFTALTLEPPALGSDLERRFLEPVFARTMGGYPEFAYAAAQHAGDMPPNIEVNEFFFQAGSRLATPIAQRSYISANYTHAIRYLLDQGVNVIAQIVARRGDRFSLSCNSDMTLDLLRARDAGKADFLLVGQVNDELPFMTGPADLSADRFAMILDSPETQFPLFGPPNQPVSAAQHAIGAHVASLVPDGGSLQIGIGEIGDAVAHSLILRQQRPDRFRSAIDTLLVAGQVRPAVETAPFDRGLYAPTEMLVDGFIALIRAGIVKREVEGAVLHGGFFVGPRAFYAALRDMDETTRGRIHMREISYVNALYGDEAAKRAARVGARFVNSAMMVTLLGAAVSDGLEDGRVVSGVGGQYNFVAQALELEGARSIITLPATRRHKGELQSNLVWTYGHETIPRHLRDIVVTEYGVADIRGMSDERVIQRLLAIADSRFQDELLDHARSAGKIDAKWQIPIEWRNNLPARLPPALQADDFPPYPFGTDFTPVEQRLLPALLYLADSSSHPGTLAKIAARGVLGNVTAEEEEALNRLGLAALEGHKAQSLRTRTYRALVLGAVRLTK